MLRNALALLLLFSVSASAQIVTGSIAGRVEDPAGGAIPEATVGLTHVATGLVRQTTTGMTGDFAFAGLESGEYHMVVKKAGFKQAERRDLILPAGMRLPAGTIVLEVGALTESVTVTAEATAIVQTQSAERADLLTSSQVANLQVAARNVPALVGLLPGVVMIAEPSGLDRGTTFSALGNRRTANQVTVDGLPSTDLGNNYELKLQQSMDAVAEVRILLSNYQAEYGNAAGASVEMVLKSGTRDFHGLASYFKRHEQFNANNFFNNRVGVPIQRYRYNTWTYNLGGPVYIPGKFNRDRDKLFFFWSQEFWPQAASGTYRITLPTAAERSGDFSQTLDVNNRLIQIKDPFNHGVLFPNNQIPASRLDKNGQALLKMFPTPNFFDRGISGGNYNYIFSTETATNKRNSSLKGDYHISDAHLLFVTFATYREKYDGFTNMPGWNENWTQYYRTFLAGNKGLGARYTWVASPRISNEFHFGWFTNPETMKSPDSELNRNRRDTVGFAAGQLYPKNNVNNLIPNASFGGVPGTASLTINGRFPIDDPYNSFTWTDKLSVTRGIHSLKLGLLYYRFGLGRGSNANQFGSFDFGRNTNNPLDTNWAYANVMLGVFNTYTESSAIPYFNARGGRFEWFAQDNWRVTRRLTLDYGLRLSRFVPIHDRDNRFAAFFPASYTAARQIRFISPALDGARNRIGIDPVTGTAYPQSLIGAFVPGVGDSANGMVLAGSDPKLPEHFIDQRGWQVGPRVGLAFDPFGKGKTAIRAGAGFFYEQVSMNQWQSLVGQEPLVRNPTVYYGTISNLLSSSGYLFPTAVTAVDTGGKIPTVMNWSFSVQQNVGFNTVVDVGYVGSVGRHLLWGRNLNAVPYGTNFLPRSIDPTTGRPFPGAFFRSYLGFNNITLLETAGSSNYHSLQVSANRRFSRHLQFGAAWTWSKSMDFVDDDSNTISPFISPRVWAYGPAGFDRTHVVKINWLFEVPKLAVKNAVASAAVNGWQLSGITTFQSGAPSGVGYSTTTGVDITGSPSEGARVVVTANPVLPKSQRTFSRFFNTGAFRLPAVGTWGSASKVLFRGPGINNWDMSVFKNFKFRERLQLQYRCEAYNVFNKTQFSGVDTGARFDGAGAQVNPTFGQMTSARGARTLQMALRFMF